jgi:hypothetical protein
MTYTTDFFQRAEVLNNAALAAGTYRRGQLLGPPNSSGVFATYSGTGAVGAVGVNDAVLAAAGNGAIAKGEFEKEGLAAVNAGLAIPVAINDAVIAQCFMAGIFLN